MKLGTKGSKTVRCYPKWGYTLTYNGVKSKLNEMPPLKRPEEMCICIRHSMSIIEKVFHYEENEITVIKCRDDIWFKAKQVVTLLGYLNPGRSIRQNVDPEDRISLEKLIGKGRGANHSPL